ncbi:hypothetical protein GCM10009830_34240 [Glycomyces endophyticus]|uniref:Glycosyltransferase 2-like domain-containing protein n=1 Tax=Glycomyces endophyticus TaxID=480996 RepID=A0ABN2H9F8_9ACTN
MFIDVPTGLRSRFLQDHVEVALKRKSEALSATAIRLGSVGMRDIFASLAFERPTTYAEALEVIESGDAKRLPGQGKDSVDYLAKLAGVLVAQRVEPDDLERAFAIFAFLEGGFGTAALDEQHQALYLHLGKRLRGDAWAFKQLRRSRNLNQHVARAFECDQARNDAVDPAADARWLHRLSRLVGADCVLHADRGPDPFDRLECEAVEVEGDAEVSAIIPALAGDAALTALRSVLRQSLRVRQVFLVADRDLDPEELAAAEAAEQVTVVRVPEGTSFGEAVNTALKKTSGEFVLLVDPSDWCFPDLVRHHVERFRNAKHTVVVRTARLRADGDLRFKAFGCWRPDVYARTVMFRRSVVDELGYLDELGPEAVEEYIDRTRLPYGGKAVLMSRARLLVLSRDDREEIGYREAEERITADWFPAYRSAYWRWHEDLYAKGETPFLASPLGARPFALPPGLRPGTGRRGYDLVYASDWRPYGGPAKSMLEEIRAALTAGLRVGVMNLEAVRMMTPETRALCHPVQELVSAGRIDVVRPDEDVDIDTLVIRYPLVLQFDRTIQFPGTVRQLLIHANQPPHEADGSDLRYFTRDCERNAEQWFGVAPVWVAQGPQAHASLREAVPPVSRPLSDEHIPGILDAADWRIRRDGFRSDRPVIGRHSRDHYTKWPGTVKTLLKVYPKNPRFDVRTMGGSLAVTELLGKQPPLNWIMYEYDETGVRDFLFQLDFWVYFPHEIRVEAFGRAILEAMASGCVVILPEVFRSTFGDGAQYCAPEEVVPLIDRLYRDEDAFRRLSARGQDYVAEHFGYEWYRRLLADRVLAPNRFGVAPEAAPAVPQHRGSRETLKGLTS